VEALTPIRRLVLAAFIGAALAGIVLVYSTMHVMWTTDNLSMQGERTRAAAIADMLAGLAADEAQGHVDRLGAVSGLRGLALTPAASTRDTEQSIPIIGGDLGGQFLTWTAERPGLYLFTSFAPLRVPLILTLIGGVLASLLVMQGRVRKIENQRILARRQALRDHLTGLPNRLALEGELVRFTSQRRRFSVLALDLDRFKPINDLFGHHAGDLALIEVARRLATQLRPGEFLARIGGDEFVMIVERDCARGALTQLARDCIAAVSLPLQVGGRDGTVGISLGIVEDGLDHPAGALLKLADRALYEAKRVGGGAFCFSASAAMRDERSVEDEPPALLASL